jgi:MYXO-CTERM domain-containing protein
VKRRDGGPRIPPTVIVQPSGESFDWLTAAIAAAALAARGRRRVTLSA